MGAEPPDSSGADGKATPPDSTRRKSIFTAPMSWRVGRSAGSSPTAGSRSADGGAPSTAAQGASASVLGSAARKPLAQTRPSPARGAAAASDASFNNPHRHGQRPGIGRSPSHEGNSDDDVDYDDNMDRGRRGMRQSVAIYGGPDANAISGLPGANAHTEGPAGAFGLPHDLPSLIAQWEQLARRLRISLQTCLVGTRDQMASTTIFAPWVSSELVAVSQTRRLRAHTHTHTHTFQFETKMGDTDGTKPFFVKASLKSFKLCVVKEAELSRVRLYQRGGGVAYTDSDAATDADMRDCGSTTPDSFYVVAGA